jgi:uncharacterized protein
MPERSLHERLRRLRRSEPGVPALSSGGALQHVERALLLEAEEGLPLKQRLERLVAAASDRSRERRIRRTRPEPFSGREVENERGSFLLIEKDVGFGMRAAAQESAAIGRSRDWLEQLPYCDAEAMGVLAGDDSFAGFDLSRAAFLDTETTGLSGGTGTAAFLIGVGWLQGDGFRVRQYFMRDYNEEPALLESLSRDLQRFDLLVTFNGRQFDVPLLETRYRLDRGRFPLAGAPHLDLLHPARRLWKLRLDSCRLQALEAALLGVRRVGDVPGEEIPDIYFRYIRGRDAGSLARVLEHNFIDVVSLAALTARAVRWIADGEPGDPRDAFSLGRILERARLHERAEHEYRRTLAMDAGELRVPALLSLGRSVKRNRRHAEAIPLWREAAAAGECAAFRELAIHFERRCREPRAALEIVAEALSSLDGDRPCCRKALREFGRRRQRLERRLARLERAPIPPQAAAAPP